ncbi:hypothetical protein N0V88_004237 [Collariella sp. IMI 366227]|nr:hypothetical protein N0V88_004237 [Collariella sp. IMI 366227]
MKFFTIASGLLALAPFSLATGIIKRATLTQVSNFGSNPSGVRMYIYVPDNLTQNPAILTAVHYCSGTANAFYTGSPYARLADQHGFIVIYPESPHNGGCWDVSSPASLSHNGGGDSNAIANMVTYTISQYNADRDRVFLTGMSSGAMMTNVLAATYPDLFTAASAYAGVPAGCFYTGTVAGWNNTCSNGQSIATQDAWAQTALNMYPGYTGSRPKMMIYHGSADTVIYPPNFNETLKQWAGVFGYTYDQPQQTVPSNPSSEYTKYVYGPNLVGIYGTGVTHNIPINGIADMEWHLSYVVLLMPDTVWTAEGDKFGHLTTMATQAGITIEGPEKPYTVVNNIARPVPGPKQALVKCLAVGLNPVDPMQQHTGLLINEWPAIIGSDCAGVVIEAGAGCTRLEVGDHVYGCAPLGQNKFTPFQETFLVEEDVFLKKSENFSVEEATTLGAGLLTAGLCVLAGMDLKLSENGTRAAENDEWIVVLGGSGTVGQFAVQIAHACGYKVLASCSPSKSDIVLRNGGTATFNNRGTVDEQLAEIKKATGGNFARIFDSTAYGYEIMIKALETVSTANTKYLTSVDDWSEFKTPAGIKEYRAELGHLCRLDEPIGAQVTKDIVYWIPTFEKHLATGTLKPLEYQLVDGSGWEKVIQGIQELEGGKAVKKIVVRTGAE